MAKSNGTRAGAKKKVPRRKIYSLDDMPAERDGIDIFGTVYEFAGPADISAQNMADIQRLPEKIEEFQRAQIETEDDDERMALTQEILGALMQMTQVVLASDISEDVLRRLSPRQHQFIHESFFEAVSADGERLAAAMEKTKTQDSKT